MSKYTTQVRFICESKAGLDESKGYNDIDTILTTSAPLIFSDFPIFDTNYKLPLEKKILKHYYTREICEETVGLWLLRLDTTMNEIMPYYNKLYNSELLAVGYTPFSDVDLSRTHILTWDNKDEGTVVNHFDNNSSGQTNDTAHDLFSNTPQGALTNVDNGTYLTTARKNTLANNTSANANGTSNILSNDIFNSTDQYIEHVAGRNGMKSYSKELKEFRDTFLNIDLQVIEKLKDLFFGLW